MRKHSSQPSHHVGDGRSFDIQHGHDNLRVVGPIPARVERYRCRLDGMAQDEASNDELFHAAVRGRLSLAICWPQVLHYLHASNPFIDVFLIKNLVGTHDYGGRSSHSF